MTNLHPDPHPLAGQTVILQAGTRGPLGEDASGALYRIEDWADRIWNQSWQTMRGNPTAIIYAARSALSGLPLDDDVIYGKVSGFAFLAHTSEIIEAPAEAPS